MAATTDSEGQALTGPAALLDVHDLCAVLGVSEREAWRYVERGWLPKVKLSPRVVRFRPADVVALIDSKVVVR